jgi:hypothetical protein
MTTNVIHLPRNESSRPDTERDQCTYLCRNAEGEAAAVAAHMRSGFWLHSRRVLWYLTLPTFRKTADWRITDTQVSR